MSEVRTKLDRGETGARLLRGTMKYARGAALVASLVPLGVVATEQVAIAQEDCPIPGSCAAVAVPEPSTLLLLAPAAGALLLKRRRARVKD